MSRAVVAGDNNADLIRQLVRFCLARIDDDERAAKTTWERQAAKDARREIVSAWRMSEQWGPGASLVYLKHVADKYAEHPEYQQDWRLR